MRYLICLLFLSCLAAPAGAVGRLADVCLIDRDTGRELPTYYHRGEYWVAGTPGDRYAVAVRNRQNERLLAVMAVDGVNVVSGETAGFGQTGYVYAAYQAYDITGWRKSNAEVAAFEFATAANSYASRTGRAGNVGVIGVALFRERLPEPVPPALAGAPRPPESAKAARAEASAPNAAAERARSANADAQGMVDQSVAQPSLGTGHGRRESSPVDRTDFERLSAAPDEVIRIRYDSREQLVAMGILRRPVRVAAAPDPFPLSPAAGFVPDPPGYRCGGLR